MNWIIECLQQLSVNGVQAEDLRNESFLFFIYTVVCVFIKRPVYLLAFFMCFFFINAPIAQSIKEYQVYLLVIVMYSYVFDCCKTNYSKFCCGIIICIAITFSTDAFLYGDGGHYGSSETLIYDYIGSISLFAHILFISSLINYKRIWNNLFSFFSYVEHIENNSYNMQYVLSVIKQKGTFK